MAIFPNVIQFHDKETFAGIRATTKTPKFQQISQFTPDTQNTPISWYSTS